MEESVRIVVLDFYMASPIPTLDVTYSDFRGASVNQVPILRCFGSTKSGQKICVHIHGVFPYLYIPYDGADNPEGLMYQIAASIDKAVNTSLNQGSSFTQHVYKISLVSGIPMYGYHSKKHQFFKIYLYNPMLISTVTNLLLNHSILDRVFQPHEAHINFTLQFMIDYNLHGMSNMVVSDLKFRVNPDNPNSNINTELFLPATIEKISMCELEADINAENILNRQEIINGNLAVNPGIAALWADEQQRRRNKNEDSQLGQFLELKNMKFIPTKTHMIFQQALLERLAVSSTDKEVQKTNLNLSVYPAETPNNANIQNASLIDIHTPSSFELSLDDTVNVSSSQNLNTTLISTQGNLSLTMDEDANIFMQLLQKLAEKKEIENGKEDDCILSQNPKEDEPNEDFLDLSMPLAAITTPKKIDTTDIDNGSDNEDDNYFETTLIPQVDGQIVDSSDEEIFYKTRSKSKKSCDVDIRSTNSQDWANKIEDDKALIKPRCGKSMPLLDMNVVPSNFSTCLTNPLDKLNMLPVLNRLEPVVRIERVVMTNKLKILDSRPRTIKWAKKTKEEKMEENLRLIRFRINRLNATSRLRKIRKNVYKKEVLIGTLLKKLLRPKFNIVPGRKWFLEPRQKEPTNCPIVSRIVKQTNNYTDPSLHLLIKQSSNKQFLYYYGGKSIPEITEIPPNLSESQYLKIISDISPISEKKDDIKRQKIKILQNKILNIKPSKFLLHELNNPIETHIKKETLRYVKLAELPHDISQMPKPVEQKYLKDETITNFATNLRDEVKQANLALRKHLQNLKDFDIHKTCFKQEPLKEENFGINSRRYNNNYKTYVNDAITSTFSYEAEDMCDLPTSKEVNQVLGEIRNLKRTVNITGCESTTRECHLRISACSNDNFNSKENVSIDSNLITLIRFSESQKQEEVKDAYNKKLESSCPKVLADIGNTKTRLYQKRSGNNIDSSSDESDRHSNTSVEDNNNLTCTSPLVSPANIPVARNMAVFDSLAELDRTFKTTSSDSDYMSLSTSSSDRNTSHGLEYEYFPSDLASGHLELDVTGSTNLLKSPKAQITMSRDITLQQPMHVQCLQLTASSSFFEISGSSLGNGKGSNSEKEIITIRRYQPKFKPKWDHTYTKPYQPETTRKRRPSTPNILYYLNCDGAADSSSDDEDKIRTRSKKRAKRNRTLSQYAPLQISVSKSPRVPGNGSGAGLADNMVGISGNQTDFRGNPSEVDQKKPCVSFKRKLLFEDEGTLNNTTTEEFLSCAYSPKNVSKTSILTVGKNTTIEISEKINVPQADTSEMNPEQTSNNSQSLSDTNSQHLDSSYSDSDLFSEDEDPNKSFFRRYQLSTSERYDMETRYKAKEGCSIVYTPNSIVGHNTDISQNNLNSLVISDNTSSDITPNQETVNKENIQTVLNLPSSENSSSNLTPYQNVKQLSMEKSQAIISSYISFKVLKPTFCAPTRLQVQTSLNKLKIAESNAIEPFYSNVEDYTGVVEVGHNTLKIRSRTTCHLPDFESDFDSLIKYRKHFTENVANLIWNSNNLKNLKLSHCSDRDIIIRPIKKTPSLKNVQQWLEDNSKEKILPLTTDEKERKTKIYIPNSPGNDQDDLELSLSVTPCTPISSHDTLPHSSEPGTSKSSLSQSSSPILDHRKNKFKNKSLIKKSIHLRESLVSSEELNKSCQITGISQNDSFGFSKSVQNLQAVRVVLEYQYLTTMVMELHIRTRGEFKPDPEYDQICAIFYSVLNDVPETHARKSKARGVIALNCLPINLGIPNSHLLDGICIDCDINYAETEESLINTFLSVIKYWDPDILAGYEIQMLSWGYLIDRAFVLSLNIIPLLGRSEITKYGRTKPNTTNYEIETAVTGRIILDVWRIMRHEIALQSYTFESIVYHILHKRVPMFAFKDLTFWWDHRTNLYRHRVVSYYLLRVETVLELFDKLDFLNRTSELARLFGILFYEVLSRGSQFRVESMMLRLAKPLNYVPVSPSTAQRAHMKAPEYIALVMEPESKLYTDPVIVLDFQSLYPSIIIAYNYCFTTCAGRVNCLGTHSPFEFGASQLKISRKMVEKLSKRNLLNFSPCGVAFVKQKVRQGILPRMLTEILDTRLMVKNSMKENRDNANLQKVLHNRQLGLKLIANVTYGYTAANFSGRMCCVEVGDSVVSKARETLQRAIALVETRAEWGARVVYGDTDSLFVLVPGKTKETAFEVGKQIADAITADNPDPVKLKLEKVYQPCILQTKKRYVGYMYESPDQKEPVYDAKGIETVRRDGCPAVSKMLQKCLTLLFDTKDVSLVKKYILRQFNKIQIGRACIQDLTFAKEYRGASGYKPGACVPALELARKWRAVDRRSEPRSGERVPYIIVNGPPGLPLIRLVRSPRELLNDSSLRPNSLYYITKVIIPPINRCFNLIGADLLTWFNQMPRKNTQYLPNSSPIVKSTISQYFVSKICASCSQPTQNGLCDKCCHNVNVTAFTLAEKLRKWEENFHNTTLICRSCTGHLNEIVCVSLDCPVLYRRTQTSNDLQQSTYVRELLASTDIFSESSVFDD